MSDLQKIKDILATEFDDFWTFNIMREELNSDTSQYIVAIVDDEIVGFAGVKVYFGEGDLMYIVTKKNFRNKGIGTALLSAIIDICKKDKIDSIFLEVNEENTVAISLYEKFGFSKINVRKNYYKYKNGIVMNWRS